MSDYNHALRPRTLKEVIGQQHVVGRLTIAVDACQKLREPLGHVLFTGPPGLGKTTFAHVLPVELGCAIQCATGPAIEEAGDILPLLQRAPEGSIVFIDEIHRVPQPVQEILYQAMEDFRVDGRKLNRFTLIGATTHSGMLSQPMRDRFKMHEQLRYYDDHSLAVIAYANAKKLGVAIENPAAWELAGRSRGTPRIVNARLWWARSYATSRGNGTITLDLARQSLEAAEVDMLGLDAQDRQYLEALLGPFNGGPAGIGALAASMNIAQETIADEIEPYLLRAGFITRSPRGRLATSLAYEHMGMSSPNGTRRPGVDLWKQN